MSKTILLAGNPNVGKSSLFNLLTGLKQHTGNYEGVTVEKKTGYYQDFVITDLPGLKSVWAESIDERISVRNILKARMPRHPVIFVVSGTKLEEELLLFTQIADLQLPIILVINFKDELAKNKITIDTDLLSGRLNCPVLLLNSRNGDGLAALKVAIHEDQFAVPTAFARSHYDEFSERGYFNTYDFLVEEWVSEPAIPKPDLAIRDMEKRHLVIGQLLTDSIEIPQRVHQQEFSDRLDKVLLHPVYGSLIFLGILFVIFQSIFSFAAIPMDLIDGFFGWMSGRATEVIRPEWLGDLIGNGIIAGLGGILIFIPQIAILFFFFGLLESTGYMSRISFLSDNILKRFGLSGSSVVPIVSGLACAIPAIMAVRTVERESERLALIMAIPFMTCSARLPVYTILIALLFPDGYVLGLFSYKGLALLGMYLLGTAGTLVAAWLLSRWRSRDKRSIWIMELPLYRSPHWKRVFTDMYLKTKSFVVGAGKIILLFSIILWFLSSFSPHSQDYINEKVSQNTAVDASAVALEYSYAGYIGKTIEPVIAPLGYDWKIGIALLSSFAAREIFVGTLSTIYSIGSEEESSIIQRLQSEVKPGTQTPRFDIATCLSLLLFYAFALQCMSTVAIVQRETGSWKWPVLQFTGMLLMAYFSALVVYQIF